MSNRAVVREVGLRDGLQLISQNVPVDIKLEWCRFQHEAGFKEMEVTSFVPAKVIPQFSDAAEVLAGALKHQDLLASVLVPNLKGAIRAMDAGAKKITFVLSASDEHNQSNVRMNTDESLAMFTELLKERKVRGLSQKIEIAGVIATSFGCSIKSQVDPKRVCDIAKQTTELGVDEITIADTV